MVSTLRVCVWTIALSTGVIFGQSGKPLLDETRAPTAPPVKPPQVPLNPERRGDILMARKMYREAIDAYREQLEHSAVITNKIGIAYHQMMQLNAAKKQYEKAIKINPQYSEAINNLGTIYYAQRKYRKAVRTYEKALKIAPNSASVYSNLGTAYFARKKYKQAVEAYQHALSLDPDVFEHKNAFGVLLQERNVAERAKFHYYLAKLYAKNGENDRALQYLRKALEEGFKDRDKLKEDPEFTALRDNPEFQELLTREPRVL